MFLRTFIAVALVSGWWSGRAPGEEAALPGVADELRFRFEVAREEARKPVKDFQVKYEAALNRLAESIQKAGDLEALLAVKREIEEFRFGSYQDETPIPELKRMREVYGKELESVLQPVSLAEAGLRAEYLHQLDELTKELTKAGRFGEALKVAALVEDVKIGRTLAEESRTGPDLFLLRNPEKGVTTKGCRLELKNGTFLLDLEQGARTGMLSTAESFSPPFVAEWEVATDGGNIRFYYAGFLAILNHESGRTSFQVRDPAVGRPSERMIPDIGTVTAGEFHKITLTVGRDAYSFVVDGEVKSQGGSDYRALSSPVTIGPAYGSRLQLRRFSVHR
ncbi:MAG: hypothetical protein KDM64_04015 [Verrucomicrobiae bacterium]|nr:hypothetical protein [Verrucomicrobiae bacterium]